MARTYIGGQAVIEGVMMRSPKSFVVAVRRQDGSIALREQTWQTLLPRLKFLRWPLFRGAVVLLESLHNGFSALKFSAEQAMPPEEAKKQTQMGTNAMLALSTVLMVGLFIAAPHLLTFGLVKWMGISGGTSNPLFHLIDGVMRLAILLGYISLIARSAEAKRLFQYHGAEHKAIWTYESELPLTVENARKFTTLHPRCGTSFLFVVVMVAVILHLVTIPFVPRFFESGLLHQLFLVLVKVAMAFPIAGVAYELQRYSAKDSCPAWIKALTYPGLLMQHITTREPTDEQLEIALLALERSRALEEGRGPAAEGVAVYRGFAEAYAGSIAA